MTRICKRIFYGMLSFVLSLVVVMAGIFPAVLSVSAEETSKTVFEQTNVLDDLTDSTIHGKSFDLTTFNFDEKKEMQVLSFVEYCYSFYSEKQDNYGLYVYLYNPQGLKLNKTSPLNTVQLVVGSSTSENYTKYKLTYLNSSTKTNYEGLFYKFRVEMTDAQKQTILDTVNSSERLYRVSGIEIVTSGATNATEYTVATTYKYSGYAAGYGSNESAESTLVCNSEELEVLSLDVHATQYRPEGTNGKNDYTQDSLHSVYFAVPNEYIQNYGKMSAVHATWKDAVLKPALVTGNQSAYNTISGYLGKDIGTETTAFDYGYLGAYSYGTSGTTGLLTSITRSGYSYNRDFSPTYEEYGEPIETLYLLFNSGDAEDSADNYTVSSEEIISQMQSSVQYGGVLVNGKYSSELFESYDNSFTEVNIEADESFSLTSQTLSTKWWHLLFHSEGDTVSTTFNGIKAIYDVKASDVEGTAEEIADRLYISESDVDDFKSFYNTHKSGYTVYLFRYQVSDYMAQEATLFERGSFLGLETWETIDTNAYFFQQKVNLDFDIIDVTFTSGETKTVIPVVSDPIDVVPDATPPVYTTSDIEDDWLAKLKMLIAVIFAIVIIVVLWPLIQPLFVAVGKGIAWLIMLPFKGIGQAIKNRRKRKEDGENQNDENG